MENVNIKTKVLEESLRHAEQEKATLLRRVSETESVLDLLLLQQKRHRRIINAITDYIYTVTVDEKGRMNTIHEPGCFHVTGYTPEEFAKNHYLWINMVHEEDCEYVKARAEMAVSGKHVEPLEHRIIHKNGSVVWVKNTIVLNRDDFGNLCSYDGIIRDITSRKTNEQSLEDHSREMEKLVYTRTAELTDLAESLREEINERKKVERQLRHLALHDNLTGLPNRRLLLDRLNHAIEVARRAQNYVGMIFIDLDGFKNINDTCGHEYGDMVLIAVARRLETLLRKTDTVARFGGDEFVVLLEGLATTDYVNVVASRIVDTIGQPIMCDDYTLMVGSSIGVGIFPDNANESSQLIKFADHAMYSYKKGERTQNIRTDS